MIGKDERINAVVFSSKISAHPAKYIINDVEVTA